MLIVNNTLVSDNISKSFFLCHIERCNGACCIDGDRGAPIDIDELSVLDEILQEIKPFLTSEGSNIIKKRGSYIENHDGTYTTPLTLVGDCCYAMYDENGVIRCSIEIAYNMKLISFMKPISCHLFPVIFSKGSKYGYLNFEPRNVCKPAFRLGVERGMPLYRFFKSALIRKFGLSWYEELERVCAKGFQA